MHTLERQDGLRSESAVLDNLFWSLALWTGARLHAAALNRVHVEPAPDASEPGFLKTYSRQPILFHRLIST